MHNKHQLFTNYFTRIFTRLEPTIELHTEGSITTFQLRCEKLALVNVHSNGIQLILFGCSRHQPFAIDYDTAESINWREIEIRLKLVLREYHRPVLSEI